MSATLFWRGRWMAWLSVVAAILPFPAGVLAREPLRVVATTGMVADLVCGVGGERVAVTQLMGPGIDPHLYKPTASDAAALARADLVVTSGLRLEGRMEELLGRLKSGGRRVVAAADSIPRDRLLGLPGYEDHHDPHVWFDAGLWAMTVPTVVEALSEADPEGSEAYRAAGDRLRESLVALDAWCREEAGKVPKDRRVLITSHDAFEYFGRAYGFRVVGLQGVSTVSEASLADVASMVDFIKGEGVAAIFVESSVNPAAMRRVAEDAGVKVGGELFSDAMGAPGEMRKGFDVGTYDGMVRYNMTTIVDALR